ncbi:hypothetical protein GCM10027037_17310 [Mucilaginibacter koreensis]
MAALSVPLVIHLWNLRQGKVLKVGSIALIAAASKKSSRSFKLTDVWLLIIRCALLAVIALLLAQPIWQKHVAATKSKGWVLIPKGNIAEVYKKFGSQLDSLRKAGFELHDFDRDFKLIDSVQLKGLLNTKNQPHVAQISDYWLLLNRLNTLFNPTTPVYLFTTAQLKHFNGTKPAVALNLHWQTYRPADSVSTWIEQTWLTPGNNIRVVKGTSNPAAITYTYYNIKNEPTANSLFEVFANGGSLQVKLKNDTAKATTIDTGIQRYAVYTDVNTADANYVKAALQSITQFTQHKAVVQQFNSANAIPGNATWVFWLSVKPVPAALLQRTKHLFFYAPGKPHTVNSWLNLAPQNTIADQGPVIELYQTIVPPKNSGIPLWTDGYGKPVLSQLRSQQTDIYKFYSRFNPSWNDLAWNDQFPKLLFKLITPSTETNKLHDHRIINREQMMPLGGRSTYSASSVVIRQTDLRLIFWLLAAALFLIERLLTHRKKNLASNG